MQYKQQYTDATFSKSSMEKKNPTQLKFGEFKDIGVIFSRYDILERRHLAINKTENTYAPGQIDEHYIGLSVLANHQHYNQHYCTS